MKCKGSKNKNVNIINKTKTSNPENCEEVGNVIEDNNITIKTQIPIFYWLVWASRAHPRHEKNPRR